MDTILIIGSVWPEPNSSAAGVRMLQLINIFLAQNWKITFASSAKDSNHMTDLESLGINKVNITLNDSSFDDFITKLQPNTVLFDRFMIEEQFGWRVSKHQPNALKILNTEDLHCIRKVRQQAFKEKKEFTITALKSNDITKREIASIYRCDISLIISDYEINILEQHFGIKKESLFYIPFLFDPITTKTKNNWLDYKERNHFITIGNFRHEPNWDSVLYLQHILWPLIKKQLPEAELHIYGAYPPPKATQLHNTKQGFLVKGWTKDAMHVMKKAKVCLAPLRFGAGIKGKLAEAMLCGTPTVTTSIGAEGMTNKPSDWNGFIKNNDIEFANASVQLYNKQNIWQEAQQRGTEIINTRFKKEKYENQLIQCIIDLQSNLEEHRFKNFIGAMLQHHTLRSTEFMSRWIEEKNK